MVESDEELVRRARRGEREAFSRLVERYEQPALAVAQSVLRCWHDARDAVQDAFVVAYEELNRLSSPAKFGPWVLRIARRRALLHRRRRRARSRKRVALDMESAERPCSDEPPVEAAALIARLPEQECVVVSLRHLGGMSVVEVAAATGRPVGTVTKQLSRAYARMRAWLEEA